MKPIILVTALAAFAAACNQSIQASSIAIDIRDVSITADGSIAAVLVPDPHRPSAMPGSLHTVTVIQGSAESVQKKLDAMIEENPYIRPIKLLVAGGDPESGKKSKGRIILVVGTYQP